MTARVLREGSRAPAPRGRDFTPSARRVDAARWEARLEAERTIAAARDEAARILEEARQQAGAVRAEAARRGREDGHAEALAVLARARGEADALAERATELVVTATRAVAERALGAALDRDEHLVAWARQALGSIAAARKIVVRANAATIERLRPHLRELGAVELRVDELPDGTLHAASEVGELHVELRTQVESFVAAIADVLGREMRARA
ncbi:MAG: hypothetical protein HYV09_24455 [Deltaproteobacteria bacterium]|nr:hypothetical protein [Deltaproteobacteria bacterium]